MCPGSNISPPACMLPRVPFLLLAEAMEERVFRPFLLPLVALPVDRVDDPPRLRRLAWLE